VCLQEKSQNKELKLLSVVLRWVLLCREDVLSLVIKKVLPTVKKVASKTRHMAYPLTQHCLYIGVLVPKDEETFDKGVMRALGTWSSEPARMS